MDTQSLSALSIVHETTQPGKTGKTKELSIDYSQIVINFHRQVTYINMNHKHRLVKLKMLLDGWSLLTVQ